MNPINQPLRFRLNIRSSDRTIVSIDNYEIYPNAITFLFGESGIGKSMISKAVYGLLDPDGLDIDINGRSYLEYLNNRWTREIKHNSFFVFQEPSSHLNPLMKISTQLGEGSLQYAIHEREILNYLWQRTDTGVIDKILDVFPKPYRPSGGEKQRVLLAMAFKKIDVFMQSKKAHPLTCFVFDEPTGSLDNQYRNLFLRLLFDRYSHKPFTTIIITHDYSIISEIYRNYKPLLNYIHFKELCRAGEEQVQLRDFSANEYLHWLHETGQQVRSQSDDKVVLKMRSSFKTFGRNFRIYQDALHTQPDDLTIHRGELVYLKAPSGMGKTTLAKIVMGLIQPQQMLLYLCGQKISERTPTKLWQKKIWGKRAGMVFQHADEALNLQANVKEIFAGLPLKSKLNNDSLRLKLEELFENEITPAFLGKKVRFLSGGQKQRMNLLRTLIMDNDLIVLDEPLNGLDFVSIKKVLTILEEKRIRGSSFLLISHNEEIFDSYVDQQQIYHLG